MRSTNPLDIVVELGYTIRLHMDSDRSSISERPSNKLRFNARTALSKLYMRHLGFGFKFQEQLETFAGRLLSNMSRRLEDVGGEQLTLAICFPGSS